MQAAFAMPAGAMPHIWRLSDGFPNRQSLLATDSHVRLE